MLKGLLAVTGLYECTSEGLGDWGDLPKVAQQVRERDGNSFLYTMYPPRTSTFFKTFF